MHASVAESCYLIEERMIMETKRIIKGAALSFILLAVSVQGRLVVHEIQDAVTDLTSKNIPMGFCLDKGRQNLYMLTKTTPVDSETMDWFGSLILWKIDRQGRVLWQIPLKNEDGSPLSLPIRECAMAYMPDGYLLVTSVQYNLEKFRESGIDLPLRCRIDLPEQGSETPKEIQILIFDEKYTDLRFLVSPPKLLLLEDETLITFASSREDFQDVFLRLNRWGELLSERKMGQGYEVCDYERVSSNNKTIVMIGRERMRGGEERQYKYSVNLLRGEDGGVLKEVALPNIGTVYHEDFPEEAARRIRLRTIETLMSPKILSLKDGSCICFISFFSTAKGMDAAKISILARHYTHELELIWEKNICEFEIVPDEASLRYIHTFETVLVDESRFLFVINHMGRLSFLTFDFEGKQMASVSSPEERKLIALYGLFPLNNKSAAAVTSEVSIPEVISEIKKMPVAIRIYTFEL